MGLFDPPYKVIYYKGRIGILAERLFGSQIMFEDGLYLTAEVAPISELRAAIIGDF